MVQLGKEKGPPEGDPFNCCCCGSALTGFEPALRLVDYIDAAFTAHDAAIAMTLLKRAEGIANFHGPSPSCRGAAMRRSCSLRPPKTGRRGESLVDDTGIEPVTPSMSTKCSTAELIVLAQFWPPWSHKQIGRRASCVGSGCYKRSRFEDQGLLKLVSIGLNVSC